MRATDQLYDEEMSCALYYIRMTDGYQQCVCVCVHIPIEINFNFTVLIISVYKNDDSRRLFSRKSTKTVYTLYVCVTHEPFALFSVRYRTRVNTRNASDKFDWFISKRYGLHGNSLYYTPGSLCAIIVY